MSAYEKAHAWRELFALASRQKVEGFELEDICDRVSGMLLVPWVFGMSLIIACRVPVPAQPASGGRADRAGLPEERGASGAHSLSRLSVWRGFPFGKTLV